MWCGRGESIHTSGLIAGRELLPVEAAFSGGPLRPADRLPLPAYTPPDPLCPQARWTLRSADISPGRAGEEEEGCLSDAYRAPRSAFRVIRGDLLSPPHHDQTILTASAVYPTRPSRVCFREPIPVHHPDRRPQ